MTSKSSNTVYALADSVIRNTLSRVPVSRLTEKIALSWGYRYQPEPRVIQLRSGLRFNYETCDFIPLSLYYLGTFEDYCLSFAKACAPKGATVLDVGANIGLYTVELANSVGPMGRVISIEAMPRHAQSVRRNLGLNGLDNAEVVQVAVGDHHGEVTLGLPPGGNQGMFSVGASGGETATVPLRLLDDILQEKGVSSLALIKMDIEGSEMAALQGATKTLRQFKPAILIELNEPALQRFGTSSIAVRSLIQEFGYRGWVVGPNGVRPIRPDDQHVCDECLFIHRDKSSLIETLKLPYLT